MKTKLFIMPIAVLVLILSGPAGPVSAQGGGAKYYVGKVLALDAMNNKITIDEYNSGSSLEFMFGQEGSPYDLLLGDEVVIAADQDKKITDIRLLSEESRGVRPGRQDMPVFGRENTAGRYSRMWDPMAEINRMQEVMNRMFRNSLNDRSLDRGLFNSSTSFDNDFKLENTKDGYVVKIDMSGLDKDNINIEVNKNSITVKGQSDIKKEQTRKDGSFSYRSFGSFLKTIPLPSDADTSGLETKQEGDIMVLKMPKLKG